MELQTYKEMVEELYFEESKRIGAFYEEWGLLKVQKPTWEAFPSHTLFAEMTK